MSLYRQHGQVFKRKCGVEDHDLGFDSGETAGDPPPVEVKTVVGAAAPPGVVAVGCAFRLFNFEGDVPVFGGVVEDSPSSSGMGAQ
jgi:hypothetical protein